MATRKQRAMSDWRKIVMAGGRDRCAMDKSCTREPVAHHIAGKDNAVIYNTVLGLPLCNHHHMDSQFAPHNMKSLFMAWLEFNYPKKYEKYLELRNARVNDRDMDMKEICKDLKDRADKAMYMGYVA